jgi:hypothetical protein
MPHPASPALPDTQALPGFAAPYIKLFCPRAEGWARLDPIQSPGPRLMAEITAELESSCDDLALRGGGLLSPQRSPSIRSGAHTGASPLKPLRPLDLQALSQLFESLSLAEVDGELLGLQ